MIDRRPAWLREFQRMTAAMAPGRRPALARKLDELHERLAPPPLRLEPPPAPRYLN